MTTRVHAPESGGAAVGVNGVGFNSFPGATQDVPDCYISAFVAKGWTVGEHLGPDEGGGPWPIRVQP